MGKEYLGNKLRSLRKAKKLSEADLAQRLDLSSWTVASYEQGKSLKIIFSTSFSREISILKDVVSLTYSPFPTIIILYVS